MILGAVCGDIAGSRYEFSNIKTILSADQLICAGDHFTDDTVMTCAVADGLRGALCSLADERSDGSSVRSEISAQVIQAMRIFGRRYPYAGYGRNFFEWLKADTPAPYHSWGNGSAMRVSFAGWYARSLQEAELLGEITAAVTHDHPEGIKGASTVAGCIYKLRESGSKDELKKYAQQFYGIDFTLDEIRADYTFDVSCQGSVPQAIRAVLEGKDFAQVIALAISIGGDSDTIAAIAGSIAEVIYPIPHDMQLRALDRIDPFLTNALKRASDFVKRREDPDAPVKFRD